MLETANIPYEEIDISSVPHAREALSVLSGITSMPQIFIGSKFIGQVAEIRYLVQSGKLQELLDSVKSTDGVSDTDG